MGKFKADATLRTENELWVWAFKRLVLWTVKKHRMNPADAEETVQEAIRVFLKAGGTANPADAQGFLFTLGSEINGRMVNRRRKKADLAVQLTEDGSESEPDHPSDPEARLIGADTARKAISLLLDRASDDCIVSDIIVHTIEGVEDPADQAKAIGCSILEVYNGRRRLKAHADAVRKTLEDG